jgi:3-phytase
MRTILPLAATLTALLSLPLAQAESPAVPPRDVRPVLASAKVSADPDDPAIWVNRRDPARSLVFGTNKIKAADGGALYVYDLNGRVRQVVRGLDRPNNVDVEYGLRVGRRRWDIVVLTERLQHRLRVFGVPAGGDGPLVDLAPEGIPVFAGAQGEEREPMGVSLYRRPLDGAIFAVVGRKSGPAKGYLHVYRLRRGRQGRVTGEFVRAFGAYSGRKEIEAIAVDDALGYVYYADERVGVRKYPADPDSPFFGQELACFAREGFQGDHEGIAVYARPDGTGFVVCTDQIAGNAEYHVFKREGEPGNRHDHSRTLAVVRGGADETDGIEITSASLGTRFPRGLFVAMDSGPKDFLFYRADDVVGRGPRRP